MASDEMVVSDFVTLQRGKTYKSRLLGNEGPVLLGLATIQKHGGFRSDNLKRYGGDCPEALMVHPGELYVSLKDVTQSAALLGAVARVPSSTGPGRLTQDTVKLVPKNDSAPMQFLYWVLRTPQYRDHCREHATGTTNLGLEREDFLGFPVPEQTPDRNKLVTVLDAIEDKIELNRRMNETLEVTARSIFRSWFVDFDPVVAKAEGRQPAHMSADTAALFPDHFEETAGGPIPAGWRMGTLGELGENPRHAADPAELDGDTPYIALEHMPRCSIALAEWGTAAGLMSGKYHFNAGSILFGKLRPYFHKVGVAPVSGICSTDVLVIVPSTAAWQGVLLGHVSSREFIDYTDAGSTGTKMPRTNWDYMAMYDIAIPPDSVAEQFSEVSRKITDRIVANIHESHSLSAIRDTLLPRLLSGEIRLGEAAKEVAFA